MSDLIFVLRKYDAALAEQALAGSLKGFKVISLEDNEYTPLMNHEEIEKICLSVIQKIKKHFHYLKSPFSAPEAEKPFWPFIEPIICNRTILTYIPGVLSMRELISNITRIELILKNEAPERIMLVESNLILRRLVSEMALSRGIKVKGFRLPDRSSSFSDIKYAPGVIKAYMDAIALLNVGIRFFRRMFGLFDKRRYEVFILSHNIYAVNKKDLFFQSIKTDLDQQNIKYATLNYNSAHGYISKSFQRLLIRNTKIVEDYASMHAYMTSRSLSKKMRYQWQAFLESIKNDQKLEYMNIKLYPYLEQLFLSIESIIIPYVSDIMVYTEEFSRFEKPRIVLFETEANMHAKGIIYMAKKQGFKTIAFQFGPINKVACDQFCNSEPKPEIKIVGGTLGKEILIEKYGYTASDSILVLGEPRYDYLINLKVDKKALWGKLHLDPKKKTILFATQDLIEWTPDILRLLLALLAKDDNVQIVIKPHPTDRDVLIFKKFADDTKRVAYVDQFGDVAPLVKSCDALLTFASTIAIEAILCDKPVLLMNFNQKLPNLLFYAEEGSATEIHDESDFVNIVLKTLFDPATIKKMTQGRQLTLQRHATKTDGNVHGRVLRLVKSLLNRK